MAVKIPMGIFLKVEHVCACMHAKLLSHVHLFATPWTVAHQAPNINGILQARIQEYVVIPFFRDSSRLRDKSGSPALQADSLPSKPPGKPQIQLTLTYFFEKLPASLSH